MISVIIPFCDSRGEFERLADWTQQQTLNSDVFEVIAVTPNSAHAERIKQYLRPGDQVLARPGLETFGLYHQGTQVAKGSLLFFTEDHCVGEPGCLKNFWDYYQREPFKAATVRWGHVNPTTLARMEALVSERDLQTWFEPNHWDRVRCRGFGIEKSVYEAVGGFDWEYGHFAEAHFAAKLHKAGHDIGLVPDVGVHHINTSTFDQLVYYVSKTARGQSRFVLQQQPDWWEAYFAPERSSRVHSPKLAQRILRALGSSPSLLRPCLRSPVPWLKYMATLTRQAVGFEGWLQRVEVRLELLLHRLSYHLWWFDESRRCDSFSSFWECAARQVRLASSTTADELPRLAGVHQPEEFQGALFRWTEPVALLRLAFPLGSHTIVLETLGLRGPTENLNVTFYWANKRVPPSQISYDDTRIEISVQSLGPNDDLVIVTVPFSPGGQDKRLLGLPLSCIRCETAQLEWRLCHLRPRPKAPPKTKKKIVTINTSDLGGGAESVAYQLFRGLVGNDWDSHLLVGDKVRVEPNIANFHQSSHCHYKRVSAMRDIKRAISSLLGREDFDHPNSRHLLLTTGARPDLVHLHNLHGGYFDLEYLQELSHEVPTFLTLHDSWLLTGHCAVPGACQRWVQGCGQCPDLKRPPKIQRDATAYNWARKAKIFQNSRLYIAAPSKFMLERVQRSILGQSALETRVIHNGVDLELFRPGDRAAARKQLDLPSQDHILVFAAKDGAQNPFKDFDTLRAALALLAEQGVTLHCLVLGQKAATEQIGEVKIHHLDFQSQEKLALYFRAADLYVQAGSEEVFGLCPAQAMASALPVVTASSGGIAEVVEDGVCGRLLEPGQHSHFAEAIVALLNDPERRKSMGRAAREIAESKFDLKLMVHRYTEWFKEVLST